MPKRAGILPAVAPGAWGGADAANSFIHARLIFLTVMIQFCFQRWQDAWQAHGPRRSLLKMAALLGDFFLQLVLEAWHIRMTEALMIDCCADD